MENYDYQNTLWYSKALEAAENCFTMTPHLMPPIARTAAAGMNVHLSKPIEPNLLWTTLQQLIGGE